MPSYERLWRHHQPVPALIRKQAGERGEEGAIRWPQLRTLFPATQHRKLMSQDDQLDVLGKLGPPPTDDQPQESREGEIGEGKDHPAMLPRRADCSWFLREPGF
jgi:hypothetical protein